MAKQPAKYTGTERTQADALAALVKQNESATITITFADGTTSTFVGSARAFDSGSVGFNAQGTMSDGRGVRFQVGVNVNAVGSKNLPAS